MLDDKSGFQDRGPNEELVLFVLLLELGKECLTGGMWKAVGDRGERQGQEMVRISLSKTGGMLAVLLDGTPNAFQGRGAAWQGPRNIYFNTSSAFLC